MQLTYCRKIKALVTNFLFSFYEHFRYYKWLTLLFFIKVKLTCIAKILVFARKVHLI